MALCLPQSATAFVLSPEALVQAAAPHICKTSSLLVSPYSFSSTLREHSKPSREPGNASRKTFLHA